MSTRLPVVEDEAIATVLRLYIEGAASGDAAKLAEAFHEHARTYGSMNGTRYDISVAEMIAMEERRPRNSDGRYTAHIMSIEQAGLVVRILGVTGRNGRGFITFATAGPDTRTTQVFINFADNAALDRQGFAPFGKIVSGMNVVDGLYSDYGEGAPRGRGPSQDRIQREGNAYLTHDFGNMDYIKKATIAK